MRSAAPSPWVARGKNRLRLIMFIYFAHASQLFVESFQAALRHAISSQCWRWRLRGRIADGLEGLLPLVLKILMYLAISVPSWRVDLPR